MSLDAHALHGIDHHQSPIAKASSRGDLAAEVHVPWGVDQVDKVLCTAQQ